MKKNIPFICLLCLFSLQVPHAQSAGSMTLYLIESKAAKTVENDKKIADANTNRMNSFGEEQRKQMQLKQELNNLLYEKTLALKEYMEGFFCSDCGRSKSEYERDNSDSFDNHIREGAAGGRRKVPASPEKIAQKTKEYDDKIRAKETEIENVENEYIKKRLEWDKIIADRANENLKLRAEISELSKRYNEIIINDVKESYKNWIDILIIDIAEKHYIEDRIDIFNVKLEDLNEEQKKEIIATEKKVRLAIDEKVKNIDKEIDARNSDLRDLEIRKNEELRPVDADLNSLGKEYLSVKNKLVYSSGLPEEERKKLEEKKADLEANIAVLQKEKQRIIETAKLRKNAIDEKIQDLKNERWETTSNTYETVSEAINLLKEGFSIKRQVIEEAKSARLVKLKSVGDLYLSKLAQYKERSREKSEIVYAERQRLVNACSISGSSCTGYETFLEVTHLWEKMVSCVKWIADRNLLIYGCDEEIAQYKNDYANYLNGISEDDLSALQRKTTSTRFNTILKLISQ